MGIGQNIIAIIAVLMLTIPVQYLGAQDTNTSESLRLTPEGVTEQPAPVLEFYDIPDPLLRRAHKIWGQLRCPICQGQNIAESDALISRRLRLLVVEELQTGKSDSEVIDSIIARYGEYIFFRPPFRLGTLLLWFGPLLLLVGLVALAARRMRFKLDDDDNDNNLKGEES